MEKKSSINDIHKVIQKDLVELHKSLDKKFGDDNPFAKFSIGGGFYVWTNSKHEWMQMISASNLEQTLVKEALLDTKRKVAEVLGEKSADILFTTPDDSYIYFSNDGDNIEILITGWGFKKPGRYAGKGDEEALAKKNPISISFAYNGEILTDYEFGIELPKQIRSLKTNWEGLFKFDDLKVGEKFSIVDFSSNQHFQLVVLDGVSQYTYDVTKYISLEINATIDNQPLAGENTNVLYNGKSYEAKTDNDGCAVIELPYLEGQNITATIKDQTQSKIIDLDNNRLFFHFSAPQESIKTSIEVTVIIDKKPAKGEYVHIRYGDDGLGGETDFDGIFTANLVIKDGVECSVSVDGFNPQSKFLSETKNVFLFEKMHETALSKFNPHILIVGNDGEVVSKYPIKVVYDGKTTEYTSDDNGNVFLEDVEDGKNMNVIDGLNPENVSEYILSSDQPEYIFHVPYECPKQKPDIKVTILNAERKPLKCDRVRFDQEVSSSELLTTLDVTGSTYFGREAFVTDSNIKVSILGSEKHYDTIIFNLDANESEYVLQENRPGSSWLSILLQLLAVIATMFSALLLWPFIVSVIEFLNN